ncbi:MAG: hypothetical protein ACO1SV_18040 [Fimbriimonas sp.]
MTFLALIPFALAPVADVSIKTEVYRGWEDSYRLSNGTVDLVVVPKIGRVMRFGYIGQRNLLWENPKVDGASKPTPGEYVAYGGDKMWPAPQTLWNWPPDPKLDGTAHTVEKIPNGIRMTSLVGDKIKVRFVREITLDPFAAVVKFRNRMDNTGARQELAAWQITQTANPDLVTVPIEPTASLPKGWHGYGNDRLTPEYHRLQAGKLLLQRDKRVSRKFGAFSRSGELIASFGSTILTSSSPAMRSQKYVDRNSPLQVYLNGGPDAFVELEHTSPVQRMLGGESVFLDVTWRLQVAR